MFVSEHIRSRYTGQSFLLHVLILYGSVEVGTVISQIGNDKGKRSTVTE